MYRIVRPVHQYNDFDCIVSTAFQTVRAGIETKAFAAKLCLMLNEEDYKNCGDGDYEIRDGEGKRVYMLPHFISLEEIPY